MAQRQVQSNFSRGELDPKLFARPDVDVYFKGAQKLRNVLCIPQGGARRRFGTKWGFGLTDNAAAPITDPDEVNGLIFDFDLTKSFLIIIKPYDRAGANFSSFNIYLNDGTPVVVPSTYTVAQIPELFFVRTQNRVVILHEDVAPAQLVPNSDGTAWVLSTIAFGYKPTHDFSIIDGVNYRDGTTFTPSATTGIGITLTASAARFNAGHVGGIFIGNGGIFRITAVNAGGTVATGTTVEDFLGTTAIKGVDAILKSAAWGDFSGGTPAGGNRGWPSLGVFFQNRLVLANSPSLPHIVWFSNLNDYYNFDDSEALDTNAFALGVGSDGNDAIQSILGTTGVIALGFSGVYTSSIFTDLPITPSRGYLNEQTRTGSGALDAQLMDNQVFFVDENNDQVNAASYSVTDATFNVTNASILSPHLITDPVSTAVYRPNNDDGSYYMLINADGTLALFQSLEAQNVIAWTLSDTRGSFCQAIASRDTGYFVTRRCITNGTTVTGLIDNVYTANEDFDAITDITTASESGASNATLFANQYDYVLIGHESPFYILKATLATPASATIVPTFEYLNNLGVWTAFTPTSDGSTGFSATGDIVWVLNTHTPNWKPMDLTESTGTVLPTDSINGIATKFWMRIRRTAASLVTNPIETSLLINTADRVWLESINYDEYMDATESTSSNGAGLVTGLTHLIGQQVYVLADEIPEGPYFVNASGEITIKALDSSDVRVGINYIPEIIPMPFVLQNSPFQSLYHPKHVKSIYIDYYKSLGITVNGQEIPSLTLGHFVLDQTPIPVTSFYEVVTMRGWDPRATYKISQDLPLPMTILGIGYNIEVS